MFMSLPPGLDQQMGKWLQLTKSLYGRKFAAKLFYEILCDTLTDKLDFYVSPSDHCLFIQHDCIIINWVEDQILLMKDPSVTLKIVKAMHNAGLILDVLSFSLSGSIANYLGIQIQEEDDGTLLLTQSGLIDRTLEAMDLKNANPKDTPATEAVGVNNQSPSFDGKYNYCSVIGMMMYLTSSTQPNCAFAIHQCARLSHDYAYNHTYPTNQPHSIFGVTLTSLDSGAKMIRKIRHVFDPDPDTDHLWQYIRRLVIQASK
jgi:hypothetical protein